MGGALSFTHTSPCFSAHWKAVAQARSAEGSPPWGITVQVPHPLNCQPAGRDVGRAGRRRGRLAEQMGAALVAPASQLQLHPRPAKPST
jgi:hypothetical protein